MQSPEELVKFTSSLNSIFSPLNNNFNEDDDVSTKTSTPDKKHDNSSDDTSSKHTPSENTKNKERKLRQFFCDQCWKCFMTKNSLKVHKRLHKKVNDAFVCQICRKSFQTKQNLKNHVNVHKGLKPFNCEICDRCFSEKSSLTKHKVTHSRLRAYSCNHCDKTFTQASAQQRHIQNFHQPALQPEYGGFLPAFGAEVVANELLLFEDLYDAFS